VHLLAQQLHRHGLLLALDGLGDPHLARLAFPLADLQALLVHRHPELALGLPRRALRRHLPGGRVGPHLPGEVHPVALDPLDRGEGVPLAPDGDGVGVQRLDGAQRLALAALDLHAPAELLGVDLLDHVASPAPGAAGRA
jgi:hypothetical protein